MKKLIIFISLVFFGSQLFAQTLEAELKKIEDFKAAKAFCQDRTDLEVEYTNINTGNTLTEAEQEIVFKANEDLFEINGYWYKIIFNDHYVSCRVRYIYFDGGKLDNAALETMRDEVISQYEADQSEENFAKLANKYTMDGNQNGGNLDWYKPDRMVKEFSEGVLKQEAGDIFKLDIPDYKWYYVILKLTDETEVTNISYLKVKSKE